MDRYVDEDHKTSTSHVGIPTNPEKLPTIRLDAYEKIRTL